MILTSNARNSGSARDSKKTTQQEASSQNRRDTGVAGQEAVSGDTFEGGLFQDLSDAYS